MTAPVNDEGVRGLVDSLVSIGSNREEGGD